MPILVSDIINTALRLVGQMGAPVRGAASTQLTEGLAVLNSMLDSWNTERLIVWVIPRNVYNLTALKQTYTLGPGGDFNQVRPPRIERAGLISTANVTQPLELPLEILTFHQWQTKVPVKNVNSSLPFYLYPDMAFPLINCNFWPLPSISGLQVALYVWQTIAAFATTGDTVAFPPGYQRALEYNLAVELAPRYPKHTLHQLVIANAIESKAKIKSLNTPIEDAVCDPALVATGRIFNWITGETL